MNEVNSPLGKKIYSSTTPQTLVVSEEGQPLGDYPELPPPVSRRGTPLPPLPPGAKQLSVEEFSQYEQKKKEIITKHSKISPEAKERVNVLLGLGRKYRDVQVGDQVFSIRTLKDGEEATAILEAGSGNKGYFWELRLWTLALAVEKIDGYPTKQILGVTEDKDIVEIFREMAQIVIQYLYDQYAELVKEVKGQLFNVEQLQDEIKK